MMEVKLKDIAEVISGLSYRRYIDEDAPSYDVIVQRSIKDGKLSDFEKVRLRTPKPQYFTKPGDILMKMPYPYDVVCVNQENLVISDRIAIIRTTHPYMHPKFIAHLLTNVHVKKQLYELGSTEKIPHTSLSEIKELKLKIPPAGTQVEYVSLLDKIDEKIIEDQRVVDYDRRLKEGILNKLWDGDY